MRQSFLSKRDKTKRTFAENILKTFISSAFCVLKQRLMPSATSTTSNSSKPGADRAGNLGCVISGSYDSTRGPTNVGQLRLVGDGPRKGCLSGHQQTCLDLGSFTIDQPTYPLFSRRRKSGRGTWECSRRGSGPNRRSPPRNAAASRR